MEFAIVATTVLVSLFVAYLAFLFLQFLYVLCRRRTLSDRRRTCPLPTTAADKVVVDDDIKDFVRSSWMNKSSYLSSKALAAAAAAAAAAADSPPPLPNQSAVVVVPPPTDEEVEEMLMGMNNGLRGPPRFLFTIKEDEGEGSTDDTPPQLSYDEEDVAGGDDDGGVAMVRFMDILGVVKAEEVSSSSLSRQCSTLSSLLKDEVNGGGGVLAS